MGPFDSRQHFPLAPTVVLYHAECADGFGAAWALWRRFADARFVPVKHGSPPPDGLQGQRVVIVDFSYGRETLEMMAGETDRLLILDHHITAEKALAGLPYAYFDMKKSGAARPSCSLASELYPGQRFVDVVPTDEPRDQRSGGLASV
jgi:hypothetical protein